MKQVVKRLLRPVTSPFFTLVEARIEAANAVLRGEIRDGIQEATAPVEALQHHLPILLETISTQNAAAREAKRAERRLEQCVAELRDEVADLRAALEGARQAMGEWDGKVESAVAEVADRVARVEERTEFVRREVMFELRYGAQGPSIAVSHEPKILNAEKLAAAGDDIRLSLGSGHKPLDEYINVDARELDGIDVVADVGRLPFEPGTVQLIHSAHLLEHFPLEELRRRLLPYWASLLRPGGEFVAVVPDTDAMIDEYAAGRVPFDDLRRVIFGDQEYDGDFHFTMFSEQSLSELLDELGFERVTVVEAGRRNGLCYEMEIHARRPER